MNKAGRVWFAIVALMTVVVSAVPVRSQNAPARTSADLADVKSEIDRLEKIIGSLNRRIARLSDSLSAVEARLADTERRSRLETPFPMADCGAREHGSVFIGKPVECYYGYKIYQCWNGEIRTIGGECQPARR